MKPIDQMALAECLDEFVEQRQLYRFLPSVWRQALADRIHDLTRWVPVSERMPTGEDGDRFIVRDMRFSQHSDFPTYLEGKVENGAFYTYNHVSEQWEELWEGERISCVWQRITPPEGV
jgi:hypothetical protein